MQNDRTLQPLEDARTRGIVRGEIARALARSTSGRRPPGLIRAEVTNGYFDSTGGFVKYAAYDTGGGYDVEGMR